MLVSPPGVATTGVLARAAAEFVLLRRCWRRAAFVKRRTRFDSGRELHGGLEKWHLAWLITKRHLVRLENPLLRVRRRGGAGVPADHGLSGMKGLAPPRGPR